jgi:hypothetical protein
VEGLRVRRYGVAQRGPCRNSLPHGTTRRIEGLRRMTQGQKGGAGKPHIVVKMNQALSRVTQAASRSYLFGLGAGGWIKSGTASITRSGVNFNLSCSVKNAILSRRASAFSAWGAS